MHHLHHLLSALFPSLTPISLSLSLSLFPCHNKYIIFFSTLLYTFCFIAFLFFFLFLFFPSPWFLPLFFFILLFLFLHFPHTFLISTDGFFFFLVLVLFPLSASSFQLSLFLVNLLSLVLLPHHMLFYPLSLWLLLTLSLSHSMLILFILFSPSSSSSSSSSHDPRLVDVNIFSLFLSFFLWMSRVLYLCLSFLLLFLVAYSLHRTTEFTFVAPLRSTRLYFVVLICDLVALCSFSSCCWWWTTVTLSSFFFLCTVFMVASVGTVPSCYVFPYITKCPCLFYFSLLVTFALIRLFSLTLICVCVWLCPCLWLYCSFPDSPLFTCYMCVHCNHMHILYWPFTLIRLPCLVILLLSSLLLSLSLSLFPYIYHTCHVNDYSLYFICATL